MSTNSTIAVKCTDGKFRGIYCHWDGYKEHHLPILKEYYNTQKLAEQLVSYGDMSCLDKFCTKPKGHSYDTPIDGYSIYYIRDRGETFDHLKTKEAKTFAELSRKIGWQAYRYLFKNGEWKLQRLR